MAVSPREARLGYWLRHVSSQISHALAAKLQAHNVTTAEWVLMRELYDQPSGIPSEVSDRLRMTRGAISKLADRLEAKGLISRSAEGRDRRFQTLALTEAGRTLTPILSELADRTDQEFFGVLTASERGHIELALREIVRRRSLKA